MTRRLMLMLGGTLAPLLVIPLLFALLLGGMFMAGSTAADKTGQQSPEAALLATHCIQTTTGDQNAAVSDTQSTTSAKPDSNARKIAQDLAVAGVSKAGVAGILGNFEQESQFQPTATNPLSGAYGIAQWNPGSKLRTEMDAIGLKSTPMNSLDGQVQVIAELVAVPKDTSRWMDIMGRLSNYESLGYKAPEAKAGTRLFRAWQTTDDPKTAAAAWLFGFEGPGDSEWKIEKRTGSAQYWYDTGLNGIDFPAKTKDRTGETVNPTPGQSASGTDAAACAGAGSQGSVGFGTIGDAPARAGNFSWMCETAKVCGPNDVGILDYDGNGSIPNHWRNMRHQCTWYAWTRLMVIHGTDGWTTKTGPDRYMPPYLVAAQQIWRNLSHTPGWTVDQTPHPGDGASGWPPGSGHVAVVEEVKPDPSGWKIRISEGNVGGSEYCRPAGDGCWDSYHGDRWKTKDEILRRDVHFFRYKTWKVGSTAS